MYNNKKKNLYISIILLVILIIGIGYAYLTSNLSITGSTEVVANTWDIHFENLQVNSGSVPIGTGYSAATINPNDNTKITYSVKLDRPGDYYEFTVDVKNAGTLDGMIESINSTLKINDDNPFSIAADNSNLPAYLDYFVKYSDDTDILANHKLKAGDKETYKIRVELKADISEDQLPNTNNILTFNMNPIIKQSDDNAVDPHPAPEPRHFYSLTTSGGETLKGLSTNQLEELGVLLRGTPSEAIEDWKDITGNDTTYPFYRKLIMEGDIWFNNEHVPIFPYKTQEECEWGEDICIKDTVSDMVIDIQAEFVINDQVKSYYKEIFCVDYYSYEPESIAPCQTKWDNMVNGTYTLGDNIGDNIIAMKQAFNYNVQPEVCQETFEPSALYCRIDGLNVESGYYGYSNNFERGSISDGGETGYRCWVGDNGYCGYY